MRRYTGWDVAAGIAVGIVIGMLLLIAAQEQVRDGLDRIHATHVEAPSER